MQFFGWLLACSYHPMAIHEGRAPLEAQQVAPVLESQVNQGGHWSLAPALGENAKAGVTEKATGKIIVCPPAVPFPPCRNVFPAKPAAHDFIGYR